MKIAVSQVSAARQALQKRGDYDTLVQPQRYDGYRVPEHQPWYVVQWVVDGKADVAAVWGPFAGWVDTIKGEPLEIVPINLDEDRYPLEFSLALAVRQTDVFLKYLLEFALEDNKDKIEAVLREYGVPLVQCSRCIIAGDLPSHGSYTAIPQSEFKARPELATPDQVVTTDEVAQALEKGADPTEELFNAVIGGDKKRVDFLLSKGADINALDSNGSAPIHLAAMGKQREMVAFLIEKGADADRADNAGMTPLLYAAMRDDIPTAKLLIEKGADVNQASNEGFTPLTLAIEEQRYEAAKLLIEAGADVRSAVGEQKLTPLMITAARMGPAEGSVFLPSSTRPIDIARMLIERGADVNAQSSTGMTPLMIAAARDNAPVIGLLLQKGAEPDLKNSGGQTALQIAELNDAKSAIQAINVLSRAFGNKRAQSEPAEPTAKP
jgi:ankyrin repeat protein